MNGRDWNGRKVLMGGAARQGTALARYLARRGAQVTLNDRRDASALSETIAALDELGIRWALGGHPLDLLDDCDLLCLSGGVPLTLPLVQEALRRDIPLSNDTQIFLEAVPCRTIGITGSAGTTTTTTLVGRMAQEAWPGRVFVGGNIGDPLINYLDDMTPDDLAILEISSFQLEQMTRSTDVAAVLNITPNHLDRHGTMAAYTAAKARLIRFQSAQGVAVLGRDDAGAWALQPEVTGRLLSFGLTPLRAGSGTYLAEGVLRLRADGDDVALLRRDELHLRGDHNVQNALAAFAIGYAAGFDVPSMRAAARTFTGVPHRLEVVREHRGVRWINDSIATAPERTMAAVRAYAGEPLILLLGGRDKNLPWDDLAALVHQYVDHVIVFGEAAEKILAALGPRQEGQRPYTLTHCPGLACAVQKAAEIAEAGDVVLLSPGGTSFDEFRDFAERGERFRAWVSALS